MQHYEKIILSIELHTYYIYMQFNEKYKIYEYILYT